MRRQFWVLIHRWAGLAMAGFLIVVGLTGSLLAFYPEIERLINPQYYPAGTCTTLLTPGELAAQLAQTLPEVQINGLLLEANQKATLATVSSQPGAAPLGYNQIFLDPCTGAELYRREFGAISAGWTNFMSFVYQLHYVLALGKVGLWMLGICALVWTIDCFVAFYLTFPMRRRKPVVSLVQLEGKSWWQRWKPSWKIRWRSSGAKLNFDLHRAGGLWLWPMLLVFAWSSVYMNLWDTVYTWTTRAVMDYREPWTELAPRAEAVVTPALDWRAAQARGKALIDTAAERQNFTVERPIGLRLDRERGVYQYIVRSSLDFGDKRGRTRVYFDADTGAEKLLLLPRGQYAGNTLTHWLVALHEANVFGLPYRIFVSAFGLLIVMLSVTGFVIWWKKRKASRWRVARRRLVASVAAPDRDNPGASPQA